ncbi:MAG TPA: transposase [Candidatus Paceibacterota bacterium]|nr:transposase [Candidatus Paceibacterota bacterium]
MGLRVENLVCKEYYHLYNRGNGKNDIFLDKEDYDHFIKLLYVCNSKRKLVFRENIVNPKIEAFDFEIGTPIVSILAWVLMPNHFHLFVISHRSDLWEEEYNPITEFMRKLSTAYAMYFNKKYSRTGSLFEGKFKSKIVKEENYFNYLFSYIHLNPIKLIQSDWKQKGIKDKNKAKEYLKKYYYSSFYDYFLENRKEIKIINKKFLPEYLKNSHINDLFNWINLDHDQIP